MFGRLGNPRLKGELLWQEAFSLGQRFMTFSYPHHIFFMSHHFLDYGNKRVIISCIVKVLNTSVPFFLSHAIDNLNSTGVLHLDPTTSQAAVTTTVTAALVISHRKKDFREKS